MEAAVIFVVGHHGDRQVLVPIKPLQATVDVWRNDPSVKNQAQITAHHHTFTEKTRNSFVAGLS